MPYISIIIPAYNAAHTITACVTALRQQELIARQDYEIIVVDDGSDDKSGLLAEQAGATVIYHESRKGAAAARNSGLQIAQGEIVCFTDADCEPTPNWLCHMTQPFEDPAIAGCKGTYATRQREVVARFVQYEYEDRYDLMRRHARIDFVDTYAAAYRKQIVLNNKGFDERIAYLEDQELSFRLAALGYEMIFQPAAVVYHQHSNTLVRYCRKKFMIGYWKAQVVRRYPQRALKDSHTPQVLKLQMLLLALATAAALLLPFNFGWAFLSLAGLLSLFLLTTLPFLGKVYAKDGVVATVAPLLLALRAVSLSVGYTWGVVNPPASK
jgi:glycosyltransferase involved in cell wall biosynthesis